MKKESKKAKAKKLHLNQETLRHLDLDKDDKLKVAGGRGLSPFPCKMTIGGMVC